MKYIITNNRNVLIFSEVEAHSDVAKGLYGRPTSAGFCSIASIETSKGSKLEIQCWGKSVSLLCESSPEDPDVIYKALTITDF